MTCILIPDDVHFNCLIKMVFAKQKIISTSNYCNFRFKTATKSSYKNVFLGYASVTTQNPQPISHIWFYSQKKSEQYKIF